MSTLGQKPATQHVSTEKQSITGNGGTSYTLQQSVSQASDIEVFVNNTRQEPTVAYTASGTTLTMTGAVNSSDSFYVIFQGKAIQTAGLPVDAAITASTITTSQTITSTGNITTSGTVNTPSINGGQIGGRRNLIINGAMNVAQRGTSFTSISSNTYTVDRWQLQAAGDGRCTITQSTTVPNNNFLYSIKVDVTTADASLGATDLQSFTQRIEGNGIYQLGLGTSSAKSFTVSFWVRSNKTGTYCVAIRNASGGRSITSEYSISSADTWEHKEITFSGDTTGTYSTNNSEAINLNFVLLAGTNHDGKVNNTWEANTAFATDNQVNLFDNTSNEWYVTGVQLEAGSQATPFEHRSFAEELTLCHRYCRSFTELNFGRTRDGDSFYAGGVYFYPPLRATPTLKSGATYAVNTGNAGTPAINSGLGPSADSIQIYNSGSSWTANAFARLTGTFEAEL